MSSMCVMLPCDTVGKKCGLLFFSRDNTCKTLPALVGDCCLIVGLNCHVTKLGGENNLY